MIKSGNILKMRSMLKETVEYYLPVGEDEVFMNDRINKELHLKYLSRINCIHCGARTRTSFSQGYCYKCFNSLPQTDVSIVHPELDQSHLGISRDMEWAKKHALQPHYVYLALTGALKVGVTRESQIPTRWIDQGASIAVKLAKTPNRHIAGVIEVALKAYFSDKTNWREMLRDNLNQQVDLLAEKEKAAGLLHPELRQYITGEDEVTQLNYPVAKYPEKAESFGFDELGEYSGVLTGIKGQYLLFDDQKVINIRKHAGYFVEVVY